MISTDKLGKCLKIWKESIVLHAEIEPFVLNADIELVVDVIVPEAVVEGETFTPRIRVSQEVFAEFLVFTYSRSAVSPEDYEFSPEVISFSPTESTLTTSPVRISNDSEAEPDEQFTLTVELVAPLSLIPYVTININPSEVITILDTTSEFAFLRQGLFKLLVQNLWYLYPLKFLCLVLISHISWFLHHICRIKNCKNYQCALIYYLWPTIVVFLYHLSWKNLSMNCVITLNEKF